MKYIWILSYLACSCVQEPVATSCSMSVQCQMQLLQGGWMYCWLKISDIGRVKEPTRRRCLKKKEQIWQTTAGFMEMVGDPSRLLIPPEIDGWSAHLLIITVMIAGGYDRLISKLRYLWIGSQEWPRQHAFQKQTRPQVAWKKNIALQCYVFSCCWKYPICLRSHSQIGG